MTDFNRLTVVAATKVIANWHSHSDLKLLEVQWGIDGRCDSSSKPARIADIARIAIEENPNVMMASGSMPLSRALVELAIEAPESACASDSWGHFVAGLRLDGFEIDEQTETTQPPQSWSAPTERTVRTLRRMLPSDIPELRFREAESELISLLDRFGFTTAKGHLAQAMSAYQRGEWSSANGELRNFFESYLNEIADKLGYSGGGNSKDRRDYLGRDLEIPFLLAEYNEWNASPQKAPYVQALFNRMHPHGGHPGLSEEEDATFRLQITLITARLFLRRFHQRDKERNE
jgi:hypothetical protein